MKERGLGLIRKKRRLLAPALGVALLFYFSLPLSLMLIPDVMNRPSYILGIPWAWLYAFLQLPMTWFFVWFYHRTVTRIEREMGKIDREDAM